MAFPIPQLSPPGKPETRITEFHLPGGLRVIQGPRPTNSEKPYTYQSYPLTKQAIYGSSDYGKTWTELTPEKTQIAFNVDPIDDGTTAIKFPTYLGGGKVIGYCLNAPTYSPIYLRCISLDYGKSWSSSELTALAREYSNVSTNWNNTNAFCHAGANELYTMRYQMALDNNFREEIDPLFNDEYAFFRGATIYKSVDEGLNWTTHATVQGWQVRGLTYIGIDTVLNKKMFLCAAHGTSTGGYSGKVGDNYYQKIMRSKDGGLSWQTMQVIGDGTTPLGDGWYVRTYFAPMGDKVILCATTITGTYHESDAVVYRSEDNGKSWTLVFRCPLSPLEPGIGNPSTDNRQVVMGFEYCGKRRKEINFIPLQYHEYVHLAVHTHNNIKSGVTDHYLSEDGGYTWEYQEPFPRELDTTSESWTAEKYGYSQSFLAEDNEAIPGLYD